MTEQTSPPAPRRIRRAVILMAGPAAEAVAGEMQALSRAWLGAEPPLAAVRCAAQGDAGGEEEMAATLSALSQACDCLASGEASGRLRAAGYALARQDEIQLWAVVDITGDLESSTRRLQTLPALLPRLAEAVWRRLRIHVTTRGLLLAEPEAEKLAAKWARALVNAGAEQVFIAGPVDAARLCWEPGAWQARAATALATLLWSDVALQAPAGRLSHEAPAEDGNTGEAWSIGAAAWQAPLTQIRQQVAVRCAMEIVEQLIGQERILEDSATSQILVDADLPPWEMPGLAVAPGRHRLILEGAVPPEPPAEVWGRQRPAWHALPKLPAVLRTAAGKRAAQAHAEQYTPRGEWLDGQVTAWKTALEQLRRERLMPAAGWPRAGLYQQELEALTAQLQAACVTIEDWLEEAGQRFAGAETAVAQALLTLEELCAGFPTPTWAAARAILVRPWCWLAIAWAYWIMLPRHAQKYLDAAYHQGQARWLEANAHALRQAYLAMAQVAHDYRDEIKEWVGALGEAQAKLAEQLKELDAPPEPWAEAELQRLAKSLLPDAWPAALATLCSGGSHERSILNGTPQPAVEGGAATLAAAHLLGWVENRLGDLATWTAADCLANTADDVELAQRLGSLADTALPLWPETDQEAGAALWLICPSRAGEQTYHPAEERLQASLQAWASLPAAAWLQTHAAAGSASALLLLRATAVRLDGTDSEDERSAPIESAQTQEVI